MASYPATGERPPEPTSGLGLRTVPSSQIAPTDGAHNDLSILASPSKPVERDPTGQPDVPADQSSTIPEAIPQNVRNEVPELLSNSTVLSLSSSGSSSSPHPPSVVIVDKEPAPSLSSQANSSRKSVPHQTSNTSVKPATLLNPTNPSLSYPLALNKFVLYENKRRFYVVASNSSDSRHRMLKIDRTIQDELIVVEDDAVYNEREMRDVLRMLEEASKPAGGLTKSGVFFGIAGTSYCRSFPPCIY
jgi:hypothetical protein